MPDYLQSAADLRRSLEDAAAALAGADLARLLECETRIHAALTHLSNSQLTPEARQQLGDEIGRARAALARCRRLGQTLDDYVRTVLALHGLDEGYGRTGASVGPGMRTIHHTA